MLPMRDPSRWFMVSCWESTGSLLVTGPWFLGPVKIKKRIEDESDMDESGEHHIEFFKA
jgi:hypothetical protein